MEKIFAIVLTVVKLSIAYNIEHNGGSGEIKAEYFVYRGFPLGILCSYPLPNPVDADTTPYTTCIIKKDNIVIFNRTTDPASFRQLGLFDEADESWQMATINVMISGNESATIFKDAIILLEDPLSLECNNTSPVENPKIKTVKLGKSVTLDCNRGDEIFTAIKLHIPENLNSKYTLWWYKGCQKIERDDPGYEYTNDRFGFNDIKGTTFASLKVKNASVTSGEAEYSCVLENSDNADSALYLTTTPLVLEKHFVYRGFPVEILCTYPLEVGPWGFDNETTCTTCIIQKNEVVIFNRTDPKNFFKLGVFDEADDSWHMATATVTILDDDGNKLRFKKTVIALKDPKKFDCEHPSPYNNHVRQIASYAGTPLTLPCQGGSGSTNPVLMQLHENLKPNYNVWWYNGCRRIERDDPDYEYTDDIFELNQFDGTKFSSLKVKNASFGSTPGEYSCVLDNSNDPDSSLHLSSTPVCIERNFHLVNNPIIKTSQKQYTVQPGSDVRIQATGNAAVEPGSLSMLVWEMITADGVERVCSSHIDDPDDLSDCNAKMHENKYYCEPVPPEDIANIFMERLDDNFTATLFLRDVSKEHEGTYVVSISTAVGIANETFVLRLSNIKDEPYRWTVAVIVAGVLVVIALMLLTLLNKKRTDVRYIMKKISGNYQRTNKPMAFLIYSRDVGNDMPKALDTVIQFFGGRRYYDANNVAGAIEANQAGMLVHEHVVLMMGQSLSVMIFVTENLLAGNDMENFEVYQGLEENIRQALPLIFICTRAVRRKILDGEFDNNALRTFMSHQKSKVIIWDDNNISSFRRGLYVALPKVPHVGVEAETQLSLSKSAI